MTVHDRTTISFIAALESTIAGRTRRPISTRPATATPTCAARSNAAPAHEDAGSSSNRPRHRQHRAVDIDSSRPRHETPGTIIGPYKLLEQIGEGGMGTVWMAEQTQPVQRTVALKLIKPGMDTQQVLARFEAERQALALMDHPNIAKVLDAGTTDDRPALLRHGAGQGRADHEVLRRAPADAARAAGAVHPRLPGGPARPSERDHPPRLKPSNVLVALYDGKPVPKVIDFGVAKATGQQLTEKTLFTGFGAIVGTLEYMSPGAGGAQPARHRHAQRHLLARRAAVRTADRQHAVRAEGLRKGGMLEMLRMIREEEPPKPSTTAEHVRTSCRRCRANRGTEPAKLTKLVRGELDWIVMKALEKDRNRRYETANGFAADVQRYLAGRAGAGLPAVGGVSAAEVCSPEQGKACHSFYDPVGFVGWRRGNYLASGRTQTGTTRTPFVARQRGHQRAASGTVAIGSVRCGPEGDQASRGKGSFGSSRLFAD